MKTIKMLALGLVVGVAILAGIVAAQEGHYDYRVSKTIEAPPDVVYSYVADYQKWESWTPWAELDPNQKITLGEKTAGVGATYAWSGNEKVGQGRMEIQSATDNKSVTHALHFIEPFEDSCTTAFDLNAKEKETTIAWSMTGENKFMAKAMGLFMDMEKMITNDFEKGLSKLKTIAEAEAQVIAETARKKANEVATNQDPADPSATAED